VTTGAEILFVDPTPADGTSTTNTSLEVNVSIPNMADLDEVKYNWNGTNYTIFDDSVILMMNFDNRSALGENLTYVVDLSRNSNNGTCDLGSTECPPSIVGKYGRAVALDGIDDKITIPHDTEFKFLNTDFSLHFWINCDGSACGASTYGEIMQSQDGGGNWEVRVQDDGQVSVHCAGSESTATTGIVDDAQWHQVDIVRDAGTGLYFYIDGVLDLSTGDCGSIGTTAPLSIGGGGGGDGIIDRFGDFDMDDLIILNRTLTAGEISQLYLTSFYKYDVGKYQLYVNQTKNATDVLDIGNYTYFASVTDGGSESITETRSFNVTGVVADDAPTVTLISPVDGNGETSSVIFNCSATDVEGLVNMTLYGNWSGGWHLNETKDLTGTTNSTTFTKSLDDGNYIWNCLAYDDASQSAFATSNYTFIVDTVYPLIDFVSPTPDDADSTSNNFVEINVSITEANLNEVKYNWDGTNYTMFNDSMIMLFNFDNRSSLGENQTYVVDMWKGTHNGTGGGNAQFNTTGKYQGSFVFDGNGDYVVVPHTDDMAMGTGSFTVSIWFYSYSMNAGFPAFKGSMGGGGKRWDLHALSGGEMKFVIDDDGDDGKHSLQSTELYQANKWYHLVGMRDEENKRTRLFINGVESASSPMDFTDTVASGNYGSQDDNNEPLAIGIAADDLSSDPFDGLLDDFIWINRSLSADEVSQLYMMNLYKYDTDKWQLYVNQTKNATNGLDESSYTYFASSKDKSGNENLTETRTVTVDATLPVAVFTYPLNTTYANRVVSLNYTHTGGSRCWYSIDAGVTNSTTVACGTNWTGLTGNSSLGSNTWILYINDSAGNENSTQISFFVDNTEPAISYDATTDADLSTSDDDVIFVNVSASDSVGNISTFIDFDGSLVSWWRMDDTNGSANSVSDYMSRNNGTAQGNAVQTDAGYLGKGFEFDGADDYVDIGTDSSLDSGRQTVSFWIYSKNTADDYVRIIVTPITFDYNFTIVQVATGRIQIAYGTNVATLSQSTSTILSQDTWHHITVVFNDTIGNSVLYMDGVSQSISQGGGTVNTNTAFTIGAKSNGGSSFDGTIDDVMIFNRIEVYQLLKSKDFMQIQL